MTKEVKIKHNRKYRDKMYCNHIWKSLGIAPDLFHLGTIWPTFGPNMTPLYRVTSEDQRWHNVILILKKNCFNVLSVLHNTAYFEDCWTHKHYNNTLFSYVFQCGNCSFFLFYSLSSFSTFFFLCVCHSWQSYFFSWVPL